MKLSKYEKETIILTNEEDRYYSVYTFNQGLQKRLKNFAERYPECCYLSNSTTFSDFLSWYAAVTGGGYSVVIPRKQTCSPYLKRFLCKWACGCPTLFFSAGCKSHLQRLTGSFHFPCSKRLQIFVSV